VAADLLEDVGTQAPAPAGQVVHGDHPAIQLSGVDGVVRHGHAVLDHAGGAAPAVPHEPVEVGHVHEQDLGVVQWVTGVRGRLPGRVVLQVDAG
jgi:hypothetical protein